MKKYISGLLIFMFSVYHFFGYYSFINASSVFDLYLQEVSLNPENNFSNDLKILPNNYFYLDSYVKNNGEDILSGITYNSTFPSGLLYKEDLTAYISKNSNFILEIPLGEFYPPIQGIYLSNIDLSRNDIFSIHEIGLKFPKNWSTYENDFTSHFTANSENGLVSSNSKTTKIYVDVHPHITDYYFENSAGQTIQQVQGDDAEAMSFVVEVTDFNGCENMQEGGFVQADLSKIGLSNSAQLVYDSCRDDVVSVYKFSNITTNAATGDYTFSASDLIVQDKDGNASNPSDSRFGSIDKIGEITLKVVESYAPKIAFISLDHTIIGSDEKPEATLTVSSTSSGTIKMGINQSNCSDGTGEPYTEDTQKTFILNKANGVLQEGENTIYVCLQKDGYTGTLARNITLDTQAPEISHVSYTVNVNQSDSNATFSCSEDGYFAGQIGNGDYGTGTGVLVWTPTTKNATNTYTILNSLLVSGSNDFQVFCKDEAGNVAPKTHQITKTVPIESMADSTITFTDNDNDYQGLDGRDLSVSWTKPSEDLLNFLGYEIFILPTSEAFDPVAHKDKKLVQINNRDTLSWTGTSNITKDSLGNTFQDGGKYKAYVVIRGNDLEYGIAGVSPEATLKSDIVQHAIIEKAEFIADDKLKITTNTTLDTTLANHYAEKVSYIYSGSTKTANSVASVNDKTITFTIDSLGNLGAVGSNLEVEVDAIRSSVGGYNHTGSLANIADKQAPTIENFENKTTSTYNNFFSGSIEVGFSFAENMKAGGGTYFEFTKIAGNSDTIKRISITNGDKLIAGTFTQNINLTQLDNSTSLVSGTKYKMKLIGQDLAGNSATSANEIEIYFDNQGPTKPTNLTSTNISTLIPTLSWNPAVDDNGNGSGVKEYTIQLFTNDMCVNTPQEFISASNTYTFESNLANETYSWKVFAIDNMGNIGELSGCKTFTINTTLPEITNTKITDDGNNQIEYFTSGSLKISANITHTNKENVWANLASLVGAGNEKVNCATASGAITCSEDNGKYTFTIANVSVNDGTKQVNFIAKNASGENEQTGATKTIIIDNTTPTIGAITGPTGTIGGNSNQIIFGPITDTSLANVKIEYKKDEGNYIEISQANSISSPYTWDTTLLSEGKYKIKITAIDKAGNSTEEISEEFTLDKSKPTIGTDIFITPISGIYLKAGDYEIKWNSGSITDNAGLADNPITLEYLNGNSWIKIADNLVNSGSYIWNIGNINVKDTKIRIKAKDTVGNESEYKESTVFTIDTTNPTLTLNTGTPPDGAYINNGGFQVVLTAGDSIALKKISYLLQDITANKYWNGTSWQDEEIYVALQDTINAISYNINTLVDLQNAGLLDGQSYKLTLKVTDYAGNTITSEVRTYTADSTSPDLSITTSDNSYFSESIQISGTSSDIGAGISSVKISIKKGSQYWNGVTWVANEEQLVTTTSNNYANWNYNFQPLNGDTDGQEYEVKVYAYDNSYKVNNKTSKNIQITLDKTGPVIASDVFTFSTNGFYAGGDDFTITWDTNKITSSGAGLQGIKLDFYDGANWIENTSASILENNGIYVYKLPDNLNTQIAKFRITAYDVIGNKSNIIISEKIYIDSTPPIISSVETMDLDADGKIDAVKVIMDEAIKDETIVLGDFKINGITPISWETGKTVNDNSFILHFTNTGSTDTIPTFSYTQGSLTDLAGKNLETITSGVTVVDKAVPRIKKAEIFADTDGIFNKIEVTFSENITGTNKDAFEIKNAFAGMSIASVSTSGNKATLNLTNSIQNTDATGLQLAFQATTDWKDGAGNTAGSLGIPVTLEDKAAPVLLSAELFADNNFVADTLKLTFSENISGTLQLSDFSTNTGTLSNGILKDNTIIFDVSNISRTDPNVRLNYSGNDIKDSKNNTLESFSNILVSEKISPKLLSATTLDNDGNGKIDGILLELSEILSGNINDFEAEVEGYSIELYTRVDDTKVKITLKEKSSYDTAAIPKITILANSALTDVNGNKVVSNQKIDNATDGVGPVIIGSRFDESQKELHLTFSESVSGSLVKENFILQNFNGNTITSIKSQTASGIVLNMNSDNVNYGTSEISFVINSVEDISGNKQSTTHFVKVSASVIINEVMNSGDLKYIELKNISSGDVNINAWEIAGITLNNQTIPENGYYLIANNNTSFSGITANQTENLTFSQELELKNQNILVDKVKVFDFSNTAKERFENCSAGIQESCWYDALDSKYFNDSSYKGTPGQKNIFDDEAPEITLDFENNTILPNGNHTLDYGYSDNISINIDSLSFELQKWNNFGSIFETLYHGYTTGIIKENNAIFSLSGLDFGRYKAIFKISDTAGNEARLSREFYVDDFSMKISDSNIDLGELIVGENNFKTPLEVIITTIGTPFTLTHNTGGNSIGNFDGSKGFGACEGKSCTQLENYQEKIFSGGGLQKSGQLFEYKYYINYGVRIDATTPAGNYEIQNIYDIGIQY